MMNELPDYEPLMREAVGAFWGVRDRQATEQKMRGVADAGTRGAVTGGQHLMPVEALIRRVLEDAGVGPKSIYNGRAAGLPGYFRELKEHDVVVMEDGVLVAVIELKSQVGSFGNNLNNRIEEAIGQACDFWKSADVGLLPGLRPWFGYLMIVEDSDESTRPRNRHARRRALLPPDQQFHGASYAQRYAMAFERLHSERMVDAVTFALSESGSSDVKYPSPAMTFQHFATTLHNRVREVRSLR